MCVGLRKDIMIDYRNSSALSGSYHERLRGMFAKFAMFYRETEGCLYGAFDAYRIALEGEHPILPSKRRIVREELAFARRGMANHSHSTAV